MVLVRFKIEDGRIAVNPEMVERIYSAEDNKTMICFQNGSETVLEPFDSVAKRLQRED